MSLSHRTRLRRPVAPVAAGVVAAVLTTGLAAGPAFASVTTDAQIVSSNLFLSSGYAEAGSRPNGSFGSDVDAPAGYHPRSESDNAVGFRVDRDEDGWGVGSDDGDFFTPGSPLETWGFQVGDAGSGQWNNNSATAVAGSWGGATADSAGASGTWTSTASVDGIDVSQLTSFDAGGQTLEIAATLTNSTGSTMTDVYYARGVDPDNCQTATGTSCAGSYSTTNTITKIGASDGSSVVTATADDGSFLGLSIEGSSSVAATNFFAPCGTPAEIYAKSGGCTAELSDKGDTITADKGIYVVGRVASLAAGASTTFTVKYFMTEAAAIADAAPADTSTVPDAPTDVTTTPGDTTLRVRFAVPDDGGSAITSYQYRVGGGSWHTVTTTAAGSGHRAFTLHGLKNGLFYRIKVRAVNANGAGASATSTAALVNGDEPAKPEAKGAVKVPKHPERYRGGIKRTTAWGTSRNGTDAWKASDLDEHHLLRHEATTLDRGYFRFDKATLTPKARKQLRAVAALLKTADAITCEGYSDYAGSAAHEKALSRARARAVCKALKKYGADVGTKAVGYGEKRPVVVGGSAKSRNANRRVVVYVRS